MARLSPARFLGDAYPKRRDKQSAAQLNQVGIDHCAVPGDHRPFRLGDDPGDRIGPFEWERVLERRRSALFDEVSGEDHSGVGDDGDDIVVGVASAEVMELDDPAVE